MTHTVRFALVVAALVSAAFAPAAPGPSAALVAQSVRTRVERLDSAQSLLRITVDADSLERKIRDLMSSLGLERTIAAALREAAMGQRTDSRRVLLLSDSVRDLARRNAEMFSEIRIRCGRNHPEPEGYLGITFESTQIMKRDGEPALYEFGAVESVGPGTPAEKAGIKRGDVLLSVAGMDTRKPIPLETVLKPGAKVTVRLQRGRSPQEVAVLVERRPQGYGSECANVDQIVSLDREAPMITFNRERLPVSPDRVVMVPADPAGRQSMGPAFSMTFASSATIAGAQMMTLDDDGRQSLGVDNGVLVIRVLPGTPARDAGLRGLDVIISADGEPVRSLNALRRIIGSAQARSVALQVVRAGKTLPVALRWQEHER